MSTDIADDRSEDEKSVEEEYKCSVKMAKLIRMCWNSNVNERPVFSTVCELLVNELRESLQNYDESDEDSCEMQDLEIHSD